MTESSFSKLYKLAGLTVKEKAELIVYYLQESSNMNPTLEELYDGFIDFGFLKPNRSRLKNYLSSSKLVVKTSDRKFYRINPRHLDELKLKYPVNAMIQEAMTEKFEVLPPDLYNDSRGYVKKLANQINVSYETAVFDGCAMLMRRLLEVLLISSYIKHGIVNSIKNPSGDGYKVLSYIIQDTLSNRLFDLSKGSRDTIDKFRIMGNLSAHRIEYNCTLSELNKVKSDYRVLIEELLYKSGLKK
jgi:hypothetical protein